MYLNKIKGLFKKKSCGENILVCPRCNIDMKKIYKNDVIIDICNKCNGIWLDDNEINKLVNFAQNDISYEKKSKTNTKDLKITNNTKKKA